MRRCMLDRVALISQQPATLHIEPYRLDKRTVARRIPHRKPHPRFAGCIKRDRKMLCPEGWQACRRNGLSVNVLAVPPNYLRKFKRECPFDVRQNRPLVSASFNAIGFDEDLTGCHEEVAVAKSTQNRSPVLIRTRHVS